MNLDHYLNLLKDKTEFIMQNGFVIATEKRFDNSMDYFIAFEKSISSNKKLSIQFIYGWKDNFMNQLRYNEKTLGFNDFFIAAKIQFKMEEITAQLDHPMGSFHKDYERALGKNIDLIKEALPILLNKKAMDEIFN